MSARILVVDDSPTIRKVVTRILERHDYRTLSASDGLEALRLLDHEEADLMLVYGEIDENVPFRSAMAIFDALIKADKDFVSYVVPNANHAGAAGSPYIVKRERRFFLEHLGGPEARDD